MKKTTLIVAASVVLVVLAFGGRELYYARQITRHDLLAVVDEATMMKKATAIVAGTVSKNLGTQRLKDRNGELNVITRWQIEQDSVLKGSMGKSFVVQTLGGRYGLTEMIAEDQAEFQVGQKVVLLLAPGENDGEYQVYGWAQGKYDVLKNSVGVEVVRQQNTQSEKSLIDFTVKVKQN